MYKPWKDAGRKREKDAGTAVFIWRPLADFLTEMIAKYADEMDFEKLPDPERFLTFRAVKEGLQDIHKEAKNKNHTIHRLGVFNEMISENRKYFL